MSEMTVNNENAKQVICQIIAAAGGRLEGKLRLFKAFYFAIFSTGSTGMAC